MWLRPVFVVGEEHQLLGLSAGELQVVVLLFVNFASSSDALIGVDEIQQD